jgi:hypothetical protein
MGTVSGLKVTLSGDRARYKLIYFAVCVLILDAEASDAEFGS